MKPWRLEDLPADYREQVRAQLEDRPPTPCAADHPPAAPSQEGAGPATPAPARRKYGNTPTSLDGIPFDSKLEAHRYGELLLEQREGRIIELAHHVAIALYAHAPNGPPERIGYFEADFVYRRDGRRIVEDTKSVVTRRKPEYRLKAAIFAANNPGEQVTEIVRARRRKPREIA